MVGVAADPPPARAAHPDDAPAAREMRTPAGEPVAVLWASEGRIYPASATAWRARRLDVDVDTREVRLPAPAAVDGPAAPGQPDARRRRDAGQAVRPAARRPPRLVRAGTTGGGGYVLADPAAARDGATDAAGGAARGPGRRRRVRALADQAGWDRPGPHGEVRVGEVVAANPAAYAALWRFLLTVDLTRTAAPAGFGAPSTSRCSTWSTSHAGWRPSIADALWLRIVDLPAALAARRYAAAGRRGARGHRRVAAGERRPLAADRRAGRRAAATAPPTPADLACDVRALGAAYLGGTGR